MPLSPEQHDHLNAALLNQLQDALENIDSTRAQLKKLITQLSKKSALKITTIDIPEFLEEGDGISGLLRMAMGTYASMELLTFMK